jgi:hypothetical protein
MGCSGSKQPTDVREQSPWKREQNQVKGKVDVKRKNSVLRMSQNTHAAARALFSEYRQRLSNLAEDDEEEEEDEACTPRGGKNMTRDGLRKMLGESVDEALFDFLFRLFDTKSEGWVNADEFVMTMGLLTGDECTTTDQQVEAQHRIA